MTIGSNHRRLRWSTLIGFVTGTDPLESEAGIPLYDYSNTFRFNDGIPEVEEAYVDIEDSEPYLSIYFDEEFAELTTEQSNSLLDFFVFTIDGVQVSNSVFKGVTTSSSYQNVIDGSGGDGGEYERNDWIDFYFANDFDLSQIDRNIIVEYVGGGPLQGLNAEVTPAFTIAANLEDSSGDFEPLDDNNPPFRISPDGDLPSLIADEDSGLISFGLNTLDYSPGVGEGDQTLTYTITATPDPAIGTIWYLDADNNNVFAEVFGGDTLTLDQLSSLSLQTAQNGFGDPTSPSPSPMTVQDPVAPSSGRSMAIKPSRQKPPRFKIQC